jgi:hypothetical protein
LSDVFDPSSIGNLDLADTAKQPNSDIGNVFTLARLVLVSPDIPVDTLMQGRANFLSSSLRRFKESYLFCNEGDLALKLASTAANYISFPANHRIHGYRLGNLAVESEKSGIINLPSLKSKNSTFFEKCQDAIGFMKIGFPEKNQKNLLQLQDVLDPELVDTQTRSLADLFTFFDCTNYKDFSDYPKFVGRETFLLSNGIDKTSLSALDYFVLTINYLFLGKDVHGGYFHGDLTKKMIYDLGFSGISGLLQSMSDNQLNSLDELEKATSQKGIQVVLSPQRYVEIAS